MDAKCWANDAGLVAGALRVRVVTPGRIASTQILEMALEPLREAEALDLSLHYESETAPGELEACLEDADALFLFRSSSEQSLNLLRLARSRSLPVIYSTDDDFASVPSHSPVASHYGPDVIRTYHTLLAEADLVWLFSAEMIGRYGTLARRTVLGRLPCPFGHPLRREPILESLEAAPEPILTIGYAGDATHAVDLQPAIEPLQELLAEYGSALHVETIGYLPPELADHPQVTHLPYFGSLRLYYRFMACARWSIGLALLADNSFNRAKTNNKYRELASLGIPGIYSRLPVYSSCVRDRTTGLLVEHSSSGVREALRELIANPALRTQIRRAALQDVSCSAAVQAMQRQFLAEIGRCVWEARRPRKATPIRVLAVGHPSDPLSQIVCRSWTQATQEAQIVVTQQRAAECSTTDVLSHDALLVLHDEIPDVQQVVEHAQHFDKPIVVCWDQPALPPKISDPGNTMDAHKARAAVRAAAHVVVGPPSICRPYQGSLAENTVDLYLGRFDSASPTAGAEAGTRGEPLRVGICPGRGSSGDWLHAISERLARSAHGPFQTDVVPRAKLFAERATGGSAVTGATVSRNVAAGASEDAWWWNAMPRNWDVALVPCLDDDDDVLVAQAAVMTLCAAGTAVLISPCVQPVPEGTSGLHWLTLAPDIEAWVAELSQLARDRERLGSLRRGAALLWQHSLGSDGPRATWYQVLCRLLPALSRTEPERDSYRTRPVGSELALGPMEQNRTQCQVTVSGNNWCGVRLRAAATTEASGPITITVAGRDTRVLRSALGRPVMLTSGSWLEFLFDPIQNSDRQTFRLNALTNPRAPCNDLAWTAAQLLYPLPDDDDESTATTSASVVRMSGASHLKICMPHVHAAETLASPSLARS